MMIHSQVTKPVRRVRLLGSTSFVLMAMVGVGSLFVGGIDSLALAIQPQIPTLQVCNATKIDGRAKVEIGSRSDATRPGSFGIVLDVQCDPREGFPQGKVELARIAMTDSTVQGLIVATTIDQVTSTGKHSAMAFLSGRCRVRHNGPLPAEPLPADLPDVNPTGVRPIPHHPFSGCRYWITLADNRDGDNAVGPPSETSDVVGFLVINGRGRRIAHGMGPVVSGNISVSHGHPHTPQ